MMSQFGRILVGDTKFNIMLDILLNIIIFPAVSDLKKIISKEGITQTQIIFYPASQYFYSTQKQFKPKF